MKIIETKPPRKFIVGNKGDLQVELTECAKIYLKPDELVTFVTEGGRECDLIAQSWGFSTNSLNKRLVAHGFKTALVRSYDERYYLFIVDKDRLKECEEYLIADKAKIVEWLDER